MDAGLGSTWRILSDENGAVSGLRDRILDEIRDRGSIPFAEFMELALYDPEEGFYAGLPIGPDAHFVTSPHVSVAFGALLARQLAEVWEVLERPSPFTVAEVGAGDGTLARQILREAATVEPLRDALRYVAVERGSGAMAALRAAGIETRGSLREAGPAHCVVANELLDNLPFHRLRRRDGRVIEVMVGADGDRLVEVEAEPTEAALDALRTPLPEGQERPVSPAALAFVAEIAAAVPRGYAFLFDYGFAAGEDPSEAQAYLEHRVTGDLLADPGSRDLTAAVDLAALASEAARLGLTVWGPVRQREALLALGIRLWIRGVRRWQTEAEARGADRQAARLFAERSRASILIDEDKLGRLRLIALGTEGLPAPAAVLGDREAGC